MNHQLPIKLNLPEHYLEEEIRCDYMVSSRMKQIWAVELDLLNELLLVCKANNLQCFACGGTLLGAVRHKGFIPWDNDVDIFMPRADYNKLLTIGSKVFKHPYFLQTMDTDQGYNYFFAKLCNSLTTGRSRQDFTRGSNCGIYIDIFPLEPLPNSPIQCFLLNSKIKLIQLIYKCGCYNYSNHIGCVAFVKRRLKLIVYKLAGSPSQTKLFELYNRVVTRFLEHDCQEAALLAFHGLSDYWRWNMKDQVNTMQMPFEMLSLPIPIRFDPVLRQQYGDYMQFPPKNQRECHEYYDFNAEVPYKEYYKQ